MNLQILCPACSRSFRVNEDLTGKTVECGACDHRFEVGPGAIMAEKSRIYPGEHHDVLLDRLSPTPVGETAPVNFQRAEYSPQVNTISVMSSSSSQTFAACSGIVLICMFAFIFLVTSAPGKAFQDVEMHQRLFLAGFVCLVGSGLILVGAKNWRNRAITLSTVLSAIVMALVFLSPVHLTPRSGGGFTPREAMNPTEEDPNLITNDLDSYLAKIGYGSVKKWIDMESKPEEGIEGHERVVTVYLHPMKDSYEYSVESFFMRRFVIPSTNAIVTYDRNEARDRLMVIAGITESFDEVVEICSDLGIVTTVPSHRIVDLVVNTDLFLEPGNETFNQLKDPRNERFCEMNLKELSNINIERIEKAVVRFGKMPVDAAKRRRPDIVAQLLVLLKQDSGWALHDSIGRALAQWAPKDQEVVGQVSGLVLGWSEEDREVPKSLVEYLTLNGSLDVIAVVDRMWVKDPSAWSEQYEAIGAAGESRLAFHIGESPLELKKEAAILLRKIGTPKSIPALKSAMGSDDDDLKHLLMRAVDAIKSRS